MSTPSAIKRKLDAAEAELLEMLGRSLPECAENGTLIFFNSQNVPEEYRHCGLSKESEELFELSNQCIALRSQLGLSAEPSLARLFINACDESANMKNQHRRGPRKLATWLLAEISSRYIAPSP